MKQFLTGAGLVVLAIGIWAGYNGSNSVLFTCLIAFGFLLFAANMDQISEFKATSTGIEAKTREVLQQTENTLLELQILARIVSETTLSLVKRSGRLGGYDDEEEERIKNDVLSVLKEIDIPASEHEKVLQDWYQLTERDYTYYIIGGSQRPAGYADNKIEQEWEALRSSQKASTPDEIRTFLQKWDLLNVEREEQLKDYEYYQEHRKHRRPAIWKERESWGYLTKPNNDVEQTA